MPFTTAGVTAAEPDEPDDGDDARGQQNQPGRATDADHDAIDRLRGSAGRRGLMSGGSCFRRHQQLVCAALFWFDDNTVPSLVVMEQFSLLTRKRLEACTDPTSDWEIGVTVNDQGM